MDIVAGLRKYGIQNWDPETRFPGKPGIYLAPKTGIDNEFFFRVNYANSCDNFFLIYSHSTSTAAIGNGTFCFSCLCSNSSCTEREIVIHLAEFVFFSSTGCGTGYPFLKMSSIDIPVLQKWYDFGCPNTNQPI